MENLNIAKPTHAHISLTRLCGVNNKVEVEYKGKSVYVKDGNNTFRLSAEKFIKGQTQFRDGCLAIRPWDDKSERTAKAEANWQT